MSDGTIFIIPIPSQVFDVMELSNAEKLETALKEEREKDKRRD
jgi:hypothetical protein